MKISILVFASFLLSACAYHLEIDVPLELQNAIHVPIQGDENSWSLDFGQFHAYDIFDRDNRVLMTDYRDLSYDVKIFEFTIEDAAGYKWNCWCEFPLRSAWEEKIRFKLQDLRNPMNKWEMVDTLVSQLENKLVVSSYFESKKKHLLSKVLMGYTLTYNGQLVGLVDVANTNEESFYVLPNLNPETQMLVAATGTALILKQRKWFQYQNEIEARQMETQF
ncbi:MAG: hypothetical protein GXO90_07720 [FCB group bacterium]|nr:hypothetical protein [FCB group bacterium]